MDFRCRLPCRRRGGGRDRNSAGPPGADHLRHGCQRHGRTPHGDGRLLGDGCRRQCFRRLVHRDAERRRGPHHARRRRGSHRGRPARRGLLDQSRGAACGDEGRSHVHRSGCRGLYLRCRTRRRGADLRDYGERGRGEALCDDHGLLRRPCGRCGFSLFEHHAAGDGPAARSVVRRSAGALHGRGQILRQRRGPYRLPAVPRHRRRREPEHGSEPQYGSQQHHHRRERLYELRAEPGRPLRLPPEVRRPGRQRLPARGAGEDSARRRDPFARKRPDALHAARPEGREHRKGG